MSLRSRLPIFLVPAALGLSSRAAAQHMYVDTNGDGVHTAADVLNTSGATTLAIYLSTDENGDGSDASCPTLDGPLSMFSYEVLLETANGSVTFSNFVNLQPSFGVTGGWDCTTPTLFHRFRLGVPPAQPAGTYLVATVDVSIASGAPCVFFSPFAASPLNCVTTTYLTSFGSECSGIDYDNTINLGSEWFDAQGACAPGFSDTSPPAPILNISPLDGETYVAPWLIASPLTAAFAKDPTSPVTYSFELYQGASCVGAPLYAGETLLNHWAPAPNLDSCTVYAWRYRARDAVQPVPNQSAYGPCWSFKTGPDCDPPGNVGNSFPANGATGVAVDAGVAATIAIDQVTPPVQYYFELYQGPACAGAPLLVRDWAPESWWFPPPLDPGTTYAWRNKARDSFVPSNESAFGPCWTFTTEGGGGTGGGGGAGGGGAGVGGAGVGGAGGDPSGAGGSGGAVSSGNAGGAASSSASSTSGAGPGGATSVSASSSATSGATSGGSGGASSAGGPSGSPETSGETGDGSGCSCRTAPSSPTLGAWTLLFALALAARRRARRALALALAAIPAAIGCATGSSDLEPADGAGGSGGTGFGPTSSVTSSTTGPSSASAGGMGGSSSVASSSSQASSSAVSSSSSSAVASSSSSSAVASSSSSSASAVASSSSGAAASSGAGGGPVSDATVLASGQSWPWGIALDATSVYWVDFNGGQVMRVAKDGSSLQTLASGQGQPIAITVDAANVYWSTFTPGAVFSCPLAGCAAPTLVAGSLGSTTGLAVDATSIYWAEYTGASVKKTPLGGGAIDWLATGQSNPRKVKIDGATAYFGNCVPGGTVDAVPLGGGATTTLASGQDYPCALAISATTVYWATDAAVMSCDKAGCGNSPTVIATGQDMPGDVAVDGQSVYWTVYNAGTVVKCDLAGCGGVPTVLASGQDGPMDIAVDASGVYWTNRSGGTIAMVAP